MSAIPTLERWTAARDARFARRTVAVGTLFGAQVIHAFVMDDHFEQWFAAGAFFLAISVLEGLAAAALILYPSRVVARAAVWLSISTVALWFVSRTVGLPFGPHPFVPEPGGRADVVATLFEAATAAALLPLLRAWPGAEALRVRGRRDRVGWTAVVAVIVAALTAFAMVGSQGHDDVVEGLSYDRRAIDVTTKADIAFR